MNGDRDWGEYQDKLIFRLKLYLGGFALLTIGLLFWIFNLYVIIGETK